VQNGGHPKAAVLTRTEAFVDAFVSIRARALAVILAAALAVGTLLGTAPARADTAPPDPTMPTTVAGDSLPTAQINGVAWAQVIVGNTVYVGGEFTRARPAGAAAGTNEVVRNNLLAYNLTTGVLISSFNPDVNGAVKALVASPDGSRVYAGGNFTTVGGANRNRLAAFDATSGALLSSFTVGTNARVNALAITGDTLYVGGIFSSIGSVARDKLAAVSTSNGTVLPFAGTPADGAVLALAVAPDRSKVIVAGAFTSYNGGSNPGYGLAAADATTGASLPWKVNALVRNAGANAAITSLVGSAEGVFGTGYVFGAGGNMEGAFRASWGDGALIWLEDCHGDTYSAVPSNGAVYTTGHAHYCGNIGGYQETNPRSYQRTLTFTMEPKGVITRNTTGNYYNYAGTPRPSLVAFYQDINTGSYTGQGQGAWNIAANQNYVLYGGEFTVVNNKGQQGLSRFAVKSIAPNKEGPRVKSTFFQPQDFVPSTVSVVPGSARLSWVAAYDRDNERLTYTVLRDGIAVKRLEADSVVWSRPNLSWTDTGLTPGQTYSYRLRVSDAFGNVRTGDPVSVTVTTNRVSAYSSSVLGNSPRSYWPFDEPSGTTAYDWQAGYDAKTAAGVTRNVAGAIAGDTRPASRFNGTTSGLASTSVAETAPDTFTAEAWVKTSSLSGGKIIGFGDKATGTSANYDRHIYMDNIGRIWFGVYSGSVKTLNTLTAYNDGKWHHIAASLGSTGMALYVDGKRVGQRTDVTSGQAYTGFWRIGGDSLNSWTSKPTSAYIAADIDEVAIYASMLSASDVSSHYVAGTSAPAPNARPTAAFTHTESGLSVSVDGTTSADSDGTITGWAWDFGDGTTATGSAAARNYTAAGTYTVTLTVTDDDGATGTTSQSVSVTAPPPQNQAPTASFAFSATDLVAAFDGSASSDADGTLNAYAWDFGEGTTDSGVTTSHTFAKAGTYTVRLTVTDDDGATGTTTRSVTVSSPPQEGAPFASDAFERTVTNGLGSADVGGTWTISGGSTNFSVNNGSAALRSAVAGATENAWLNGVSSSNTDARVSLALQQAATGGGVMASLMGRVVGGDDYRARVKVLSTGAVQLAVTRGATVLSSTTLAGLTYTTGEKLEVRLQVVGTNPTTMRAKLWRTGEPEPSAWQVSASDATAALQTAGSIGLQLYLSGSSTVVPLSVRFDDLMAQPAP
jgi:PKD repeat protein